MSTEENNDVFGIGELSKQTGVNTVTLRAWERRYGLLKPQRTPKGHRLYQALHVEQVKQITDWINRGVPVSQVKTLLSDPQVNSPSQSEHHWQADIEAIVEAAIAFKGKRLRQLLADSLLQYPADQARTQLLAPAAKQLIHYPAAEALFDNLLTQYCQQRLNNAAGGKAQPAIMLLLGPHSSASPLAIAGLSLQDQGARVSLLSQPYALSEWKALICESNDHGLIYYQDGRWSGQEVELASELLIQQLRLHFCGSAPALSGIQDTRIHRDIDQAIRAWLAN